MRSIWVVFLLCISVPASLAMGWYDRDCCSDRDCYQVGVGEVEKHVGGWYVVAADETLPFTDERVKVSLDVNMHLCMNADGPHGSLQVVCLYVPDPGT